MAVQRSSPHPGFTETKLLRTMLGLALQVPNLQGVELGTEVVSGVLFALGLVYTGMVRPSKVRPD